MDELAKIKSIKKNKQSRAYVTGLHSTPAGMEAANLLLKYNSRTNRPVLFALMAFPGLERLLSLGGFAALKDAWPVMAKRLNRYLPANSLCTQTQFGLLIQVWDSKAIQTLAHDGLKFLTEHLNRPFTLSDSSKLRSFSICSYTGYLTLPDSGERVENAESLLSKLGIAANSAKHSEHRLRQFNPSLQKLLTRQEYAISHLPNAAQQEQLDLRLQPQISTKTKSICGAQAQVIWRDPYHGDVPISELSAAADLTGTQIDMVRLSIKQSTQLLKDLKKKNHLSEDFRVSISVPFEIFSCHNFHLAKELTENISRSDLSPNNYHIVLEGNPDLTAVQYTHALNGLKKLKDLNFPLCLCYSNNQVNLKILTSGLASYLTWDLNTCKDLKPRNQIKLLGTVIAMAYYNQLGLAVEGVNLREQLKLINKRRVDIIQGALFSSPLSRSGFGEYMDYSYRRKPKLTDK